MDNTQQEIIQQLVDKISLLPADVQEDMKRQLSELLDEFLEPPLESTTVADDERVTSPSPSGTLPDLAENANGQHEHLDIIESSPDVLARCGNDEGLSHGDDIYPLPTSTISLNTDVLAGVATAANETDVQEESKADGGPELGDSSLRAVRGSRAILDTKHVQATCIPNPGDLKFEGKNMIAVEASGSSEKTHSRLLKASNVHTRDSAPLPVEDFRNRNSDHPGEPGTCTPGLHRNAGSQSSAPLVVPAMTNDQYHLPYVSGNIPFASRHPPETQGSSSQAYSGQTPLPYPPVPMPYPGLPVVLLPGYGNLSIPMQRTSSTDQVPVRRPFGNSQCANVDVTEAPRASEAGPSRAGRKGAKKATRKEAVVYICELPDCPLPGKQFYDKRELLRHQKRTRAHSKDRFPCLMCDGTFGRKDAVTRHVKNIHKRPEVVAES